MSIRYIELVLPGHRGPAWIARVRFSKTGRTVYFNRIALRRGSGVLGNHFDTQAGEEYWVSGVKRRGTNRHPHGGGSIQVEAGAVDELLALTGAAELDPSRFTVIPDLPPTDGSVFVEAENTQLT